MRWFRKHRSGPGWLALLAFCLQLAAAIGHTHSGGLPRTKPVVVAAVDNAAQRPVSGATDRDDLCPICIYFGLIASAQLGAAPALPFTAIDAFVFVLPPADPAPAPERYVAFRSRAPPVS